MKIKEERKSSAYCFVSALFRLLLSPISYFCCCLPLPFNSSCSLPLLIPTSFLLPVSAVSCSCCLCDSCLDYNSIGVRLFVLFSLCLFVSVRRFAVISVPFWFAGLFAFFPTACFVLVDCCFISVPDCCFDCLCPSPCVAACLRSVCFCLPLRDRCLVSAKVLVPCCPVVAFSSPTLLDSLALLLFFFSARQINSCSLVALCLLLLRCCCCFVCENWLLM